MKKIIPGLFLCLLLSHCSPSSRLESFQKAIEAEEQRTGAAPSLISESERKLSEIATHRQKNEESHALCLTRLLMAQFPSDQVQTIGDALREELQQTQARRLNEKLHALEQAVVQTKPALFTSLTDIRGLLDDGQDHEAMTSVGELVEKAPAASVSQTGQMLIDEIRRQSDEQLASMLSALTAAIAQLESALLGARTPDDLKPIVGQIKALQIEQKSEGLTQGDNAVAIANQFALLNHCIETWQTFLYDLNTRRFLEARSLRDDVAQSFLFVPESPISNVDVLKHLDDLLDDSKFLGDTPLTCAAILARIKGPDDLEAAQAQFEQLRAWKPALVPEASSHYLAFLIDTWNEIKQGQSVDLPALTAGFVPDPPEFTRLRDLLCLQGLPAYLGVSGADAPQPNEPPNAYLDRLTQNGLETHRWFLVKKIVHARNPVENYEERLDSTTLDYLISAEDQMAAAQYALAVLTYSHALSSPSTMVPAKFIGEQLDLIKHKHPRDYAQAMGISVNIPDR